MKIRHKQSGVELEGDFVRVSGGVTGTPCEDGIVIAWDLGKEDSSVVHAGQHQKEAA